MPDNDCLPRGLRRHWRQVADAVDGRQPPNVVGERLEKAMAAELREADGATKAIAYAVCAAAANRTEEVERVVGRLPVGWVRGPGAPWVEAARSLASAVDGGRISADEDVLRATAIENGLRGMAYRSCLGPIEPLAQGRAFSSLVEYNDYVASCLDEVRFDLLAAAVSRSETAHRIRAPRTRRRPRTTREMLNAPI